MEIQSDIIVFRNETSQELHGGDQFEFHFERPNEIVVDPGDNPPSYDYSLRFTIEGLTLDEDQNEGGIHVDMINTQEHPDVKYKIFNERQLQPSQIDVVITKDLIESGINTLRFRIDQAISSLTLSNFILWFGKQSFGVNVKAAPYFAKGDGVTDDREAIQKAIDDLHHSPRGGGILYFPGGEYVIGSPGLVIPRGNQKTLIFRGEGVVATQLYGGNLDSFTPVIRYEDTDEAVTNHQWENMFIGRGTHGPVFVLASKGDTQRVVGCVFRNIHFSSKSLLSYVLNGKLDTSLPFHLHEALDEGTVPPPFNQDPLNLNISSDAYVEVEEEGRRWRIVDAKVDEVTGNANATEYVIRKYANALNSEGEEIVKVSETEESPYLRMHLGTGLTFSIDPVDEQEIEQLIGELNDSNSTLETIKPYFSNKGLKLDENAYAVQINPPDSSYRWKVINNKINGLNEVADDFIRNEYVVWRAGNRLYVYLSWAVTRIEGLLHGVFDTVSIRGGVTALRLLGSHFTTINLHTTLDSEQINAIDVQAGNITMISTRIEACDGGYGLRLNNCHNAILDGIWFEGKRTHPRIEIMPGSYNLNIFNPVLASPTMKHLVGLLVHNSVSNVRLIGGEAGNFKDMNGSAIKVKSGAQHIHVECIDSSPGFSRDSSVGNFWVEEVVKDVVIELHYNKNKGNQVIYKAGQIGEAGQNQTLRIDDFNIFSVENAGEISSIFHGTAGSGYEGQILRLLFKDDNTTILSCVDNIYLDGGNAFSSSTNATLSLICDGNNKWYEIGRSSGGECPPRPIPPIPQDVLPNDWLGKAIIRINDFWMRLRNWIRDMLVPPRVRHCGAQFGSKVQQSNNF
jgi:hypothetical protein